MIHPEAVYGKSCAEKAQRRKGQSALYLMSPNCSLDYTSFPPMLVSPRRTAINVLAAACPLSLWFSIVDPPICGVMMTLSNFKKS